MAAGQAPIDGIYTLEMSELHLLSAGSAAAAAAVYMDS